MHSVWFRKDFTYQCWLVMAMLGNYKNLRPNGILSQCKGCHKAHSEAANSTEVIVVFFFQNISWGSSQIYIDVLHIKSTCQKERNPMLWLKVWNSICFLCSNIFLNFSKGIHQAHLFNWSDSLHFAFSWGNSPFNIGMWHIKSTSQKERNPIMWSKLYKMPYLFSL